MCKEQSWVEVMIMKRILLVALALIMVLALAGCSSEPPAMNIEVEETGKAAAPVQEEASDFVPIEQGLDYIGMWRLTSFEYENQVYTGENLGTEMTYFFEYTGNGEVVDDGVSYPITWEVSDGVIVVDNGANTIALMSDGEKLIISKDGFYMEFERDYAGSYHGSPWGSAKLLQGKTLLVTIFVNMEGYEWSEEDIHALKGKYDLAKEYLEDQAKKYGKDLDLLCDFEAYPDLYYMTNADAEIFADGVAVDDLFALLDTISVLDEYIENYVPYLDLCEKYQTSSISYCFQVKKWADSNYEFFYNADLLPTVTYNEKFVLFDMDKWGAETLPHEFLHTFGAVDLYLESPANGVSGELVQYSGENYADDIMGNWGEKQVHDRVAFEIDSITAYCIGWLDEIPELDMFPKLKRHTPAMFYDHQRYIDPDDITEGGTIPPSGGSVHTDGIMEFEFTPGSSDLWVFATADCGDLEPWIEIYNSRGTSLIRSRTGGEGNNVIVSYYLYEGETYTVRSSFVNAGMGNTTGNYTLTVGLPEPIPGSGGTTQVNNACKYNSFTPDQSGTWEFRPTGGEGTKLFYYLFSEENEYKTKMGEAYPEGGGDAFISAQLEAGKKYILHCYYVSDGSTYTVTVAKK